MCNCTIVKTAGETIYLNWWCVTGSRQLAAETPQFWNVSQTMRFIGTQDSVRGEFGGLFEPTGRVLSFELYFSDISNFYSIWFHWPCERACDCDWWFLWINQFMYLHSTATPPKENFHKKYWSQFSRKSIKYANMLNENMRRQNWKRIPSSQF